MPGGGARAQACAGQFQACSERFESVQLACKPLELCCIGARAIGFESVHGAPGVVGASTR